MILIQLGNHIVQMQNVAFIQRVDQADADGGWWVNIHFLGGTTLGLTHGESNAFVDALSKLASQAGVTAFIAA